MEIELLHSYFVLALECVQNVANAVILAVHEEEGDPWVYVEFVRQKARDLCLRFSWPEGREFSLEKGLLKIGVLTPYGPWFHMTYEGHEYMGMIRFERNRHRRSYQIASLTVNKTKFCEALAEFLICLSNNWHFPTYPGELHVYSHLKQFK